MTDPKRINGQITPPQLCSCGCGEWTNPGREFLPNHHRRGVSIILHTLADRFWSKVDKNGPVPEHCPELGPCWLWTGSRSMGYGYIFDNGRNRKATHVSWELNGGLIPDGMWLLHHCDNPPCVRYSHLFLGTHQDNTDDMIAKGRYKTLWVNGHHQGRGENAPFHKLTNAQVEDIRRRYRPYKVTAKMLAAEHGVSRSQVNQILMGTTRKWG